MSSPASSFATEDTTNGNRGYRVSQDKEKPPHANQDKNLEPRGLPLPFLASEAGPMTDVVKLGSRRFEAYLNIRYIAIFLGTAHDLNSDALMARPGVELYRFDDGPDAEEQIELALLTELHCPLKLAFVGRDAAKRYAGLYYGTWIEDRLSGDGDLLAFWGID